MTSTWLGDLLASSNDPQAAQIPARVIGTSFQPSLTAWVLCVYTVQQVQTTGQDGTVALATGPVDPPVAVPWGSSRVSNANLATHTDRKQLMCVVPPGHFVKLVATGAGTPSIIEQVEIAIS